MGVWLFHNSNSDKRAYFVTAPYFSCYFSSEHIRHVHVAAKASVLAAISVVSGVHLHADLAPDATALDAGRPDCRIFHHTFRFPVEVVLIGQAAVPSFLFSS